MPISNQSNSPLDFSLTPLKKQGKDYLQIGFTDQTIKTSEVAGRTFSEPTGFFSLIIRVYQMIVSLIWDEVNVKVIESPSDGSQAAKINNFAIESSVFIGAVKNIPNTYSALSSLSGADALEDIKFSHFIETFFPSTGKAGIGLWQKLGPPFSDDIKKNLERALADPKNWSKIPTSLLTSSQELEPLQKEVQEILLSQLNEFSMKELGKATDPSKAIAKVFFNSYEKALNDNYWDKVTKLNVLINSLPQNCEWIKAPLVELLKVALNTDNTQIISRLLPIVTKRCPENNWDLLLSYQSNNKAIFKELLQSILDKGARFTVAERWQLIEKATQLGCVDVIQSIIDYNAPKLSEVESDTLRWEAFSSSLKVSDPDVAKFFLQAIQLNKHEMKKALILAVVNGRKDINALILNDSYLKPDEVKVLRGSAFIAAVNSGQLDFAKELFNDGPISAEDCLAVIRGSIQKNNKEILSFLLGLYKANEVPNEIFQSILFIANRDFVPSIFLELFLSNKLTKEQNKLLREKFKDFIAIQSKNINTLRGNLKDKHQQLNNVLEELSKNKIHYDYPFDSICQNQNFRFYRQAVNDFPEKFLEVIGTVGLPREVEFLGEEGIDAGGLFRDFVGHIIEGLIKEDSGVLDIDRDTGLPRLKESADFDPQKKKSRADFMRFGYFLSRLYDYNKNQLNRSVAAGYRPGSDNPCVIGNCFDQSLFTLLNVAENQQQLESALKDHIKKMLFSKGESLGWAEKAPAQQLRNRVDQFFSSILNSLRRISNPSSEPIQVQESWALFTTSQYGNTSQSPKVTACYENLLEAQKMLKTISNWQIEGDFKKMIDEFPDRFPQIKASYEKLQTAQNRLDSIPRSSSKEEVDKIQRKVQDKFEALVSSIKETIQKSKEELLNVYESEGNPRPTHCVFLDDNPSSEQLILAESLNKGITFQEASFEDLTGVSLDEKFSDYAEAIKEMREGLKFFDNGLLGELASDPIAFSKKVQGEEATIDSLMNALRLPFDASADMQTQKGWIREWLEKDPNNLTKFIKSITGANQLPPGKNISLEAQDRIFIHTCFFSMDLHSRLPSQVTKEKFFDRIEESIGNTKFTGA